MGFWNKRKALGIHCEGSRVFLAVLEMESKDRVEPVLLIEGKLPEIFDAYALKDSGARNDLADLIADIIEENDINLRNARFALNHDAVFVKRSPILSGDTNKIREHLRWEAITILDAQDEVLVTDFFSVTDWTFSAAIREKVLDLYRDIAKRSGIKKMDVDVPHFGLYNAVDDVKSASDWSYRNKFASYDTLAQGDSFGYVSQLAGYARAADKKAGGWWVVNKANGEFKYVKANIHLDEEISKIQNTVDVIKDNTFKRCFEPVPETWRGKETGNMVLNDNCRFCSYKYACFPTLQEKPAKYSQAKEPRMVSYVHEK